MDNISSSWWNRSWFIILAILLLSFLGLNAFTMPDPIQKRYSVFKMPIDASWDIISISKIESVTDDKWVFAYTDTAGNIKAVVYDKNGAIRDSAEFVKQEAEKR